MVENAKNEFIELITEINKAKGLDDLTSNIIGILFIEPKEISLDELAEKTGYSLSAVSTSMKLLAGSPMIKRVKKPGSRKVYFFMEKNMAEIMHQAMKTAMGNIMIMKERLPEIIEKYKKDGGSKEERRIIENHYKMVKEMGCIMDKITEMIKEAHAKCEPRKS